MKRYPKYKESGVPWLGQVPLDWPIVRYKYVFREKHAKKESTLQAGAISFGRVVYKDDEMIPPATKASYQEVLKGEYLINPINLNYDLKSLRTALSEINVCVSPAYIVLRATIDSEPRYLKYQLHLFDVSHMKTLGAGVRQTISFGDIGVCGTIVPPKEEQTAIASFLDRVVGEIDSTITSQERMIELLKERRSAIITQAVTKGLDPKAKMKDSGVPWLGQVPAHWPLVRIGSQTALRSEKGSDKDFTPLSVTKLGVVPQLETAAKTDDGDNRKIVRKGDFVINGRSDRKGSSGVSAMDGSVSLINITIKLGAGFYPRFAHHLFRSYAFQEEFYRWGKGIVADLWSTNYWDLKRIMCAMPTLEEQESIAKFLDAELVEMDSAISSQEQMIELLKERRSAIITQAVTGQIDVR